VKHLKHISLLKEIKSCIFNRLDKEGTYRRIDEDAARSIVRGVIGSYIEAAKDYYEDE
jgi:hypothetical protein|tara:strand:- start:1646 stop:1819 length:174 start_codon:yes stop_codon:yes gene_type:complete